MLDKVNWRRARTRLDQVGWRHMLSQVIWWLTRTGLSFPAPDLQQVMEEFDSAIKQAVVIVEGKTKVLTGSSLSGAAFLPDHPSSKSAVVRVYEALLQLKDRLTGQVSELAIIPIVGMGGIGKTKLAQVLYEDQLIAFHFHVRAWTTISQDYNVREVLLGLLRRPNEKLDDELTKCTDDRLKEILYKRLFGKRYLVVLDDMWSIDSWVAIRNCFPKEINNGSRIMITTRDSNVARCVGKQCLPHEVQLMNGSQSWNLLDKIVFGEEKCPGALQEIGRKIASDCGGLPLAINVIGGILSKAERSVYVWQHIANDVKSTIAETSNSEFSNVLDLSYNHLPNQLKPCFLYMGAFPEDYRIKGSRLIRLLVAEGFAESHGDKSMEEVAEDYLEALVERNLVMVTRKRSNGKALLYGMHDLLRDMCRRKSGEEKFVHVIKNERSVEVARALTLKKVRRVSVHASADSNGMEDVCAMPLARSFICLGGGMIVSPVFLVLSLLRVLDVFDVQFKEFPVEVLQLVNLRFLALSCSSRSDVPREISRLLNLQALIAQLHRGDVPDEIWEMSELRHLNLYSCLRFEVGSMKQNMQEKLKLQTLRGVFCDRSVIRMGFFNTIPNIKSLGISMNDPTLEWIGTVVDLSHLVKLKTLRCFSNGWRHLPILRFPPSLTKLTLFHCVIYARDWKLLCAVPKLEVLKICYCEFPKKVIELEATEEDEYVFGSLQFLHLQNLKNLVRWTADYTNFPTLRKLVVIECPVLEEIPSSIGDISTLQRIQVSRCKPSVEASAKQIQEEQSENGNYDLKVAIYH